MKSVRSLLCTLLVCTLLTSCSASMTRSATAWEPPPLVVAACPKPPPLTDPSFGGTTQALVQLAILYRQCRAAMGLDKPPP